MDPSDQRGLYRPSDEHDACGVGFVAHIKGARSHAIVRQALDLLINLEHRGACGSDPEHRRRRRHPRADAGSVPPRRRAAVRAAAGRAVRRRARVPAAATDERDAACERWSSASSREEGQRRARLARRADRPLRAIGPSAARGRAGLRAAVRRPDRRPRRLTDAARALRAQAVRHPQAHRARGRRLDAAAEHARRSTSSACRRRRSSTRAC